MKLTYQEMVENFGLIYLAIEDYYHIEDSNKAKPFIQEEFNCKKDIDPRMEHSIENSIKKLRKKILDDTELQLELIDKQKQEFNKLPFLEKKTWQFKNRKLNFDSIAHEKENKLIKQQEHLLNNIKINKIDKDLIYNLNSPKIIKNKDELYVVVTNHNQLDIGLYKATISDVDYYISCVGTIELNATINIFDNNKNNLFNLSSNEKELLNNYSYHNVFINKEDAVKFHNESLENKIKKMEELIIYPVQAKNIFPKV